MFDSIQTKLLLVVAGAAILIFGAVTALLTTQATDKVSQAVTEKVKIRSKRLGSALNGEMKEKQKIAQTLASTMEHYDRKGASRREVNGMLKQVARETPSALGVYVAYEPNAFDWEDAWHEDDSTNGSNAEGRFAPYWNRYGGSLNLTPLENLESHDWYTKPIRTGEAFIKGPFMYEGRMMLSYLQPIVRDGSPIGIAGLDVSVDYWQKKTQQVDVQESGYAFIVGEEGTFVAHPKTEWVGTQTLQAVADSASIPAFRKMAQHVKKGETGRFEFMDPITGTESIAWLHPIETGGFAIGTVAPRKEVLAGAYSLRNTFLWTSGLALLALLVLLFVLIRQTVAAPLRTVTAKVQSVAEGETDTQIENNRSDEIGQLADAFNEMSTQIRRSRAALEEKQKEAEQKAEEAQAAEQEAVAREERLQERVETMLEAMDRFAEGDLTVRLPETRDGAIGRLFDGFNRAADTLHQMVRQVREAVAATASSASQIRTSSEEMAAGAEQQSVQAEEVAAAVEELNQTINENAQSVQHTAEAARTGGQQARRGQEVVAETAEKIEEIAGVVEHAADTIERLGASSEEIGQVVETIDEIADQTNLLALNAAIEAARAGGEGAGQSGQGFAVVAEEVRELAEEADQATDEIADMIERVQAETSQAVEAVRSGTERAEEGLELADQAGSVLEEIVASTEQVEDRTDEIAAASEEQSSTSGEMARSVQSISTAAQQSAMRVTNVSEAAADLESLTSQLHASVQQFTLEGDELQGTHGTHSASKTGNGTRSPESAEPSPTPDASSPNVQQRSGGDGRPHTSSPPNAS
ncbi:MAG: methyl-accepting chemotaxis protein [Salinibacter sp.]